MTGSRRARKPALYGIERFSVNGKAIVLAQPVLARPGRRCARCGQALLGRVYFCRSCTETLGHESAAA